MSIEVGDILYRYMIRKDKFVRHKGVVELRNGYKIVRFREGVTPVRCPRDADIGVVRHVGPCLWLDDKDDELARQIWLGFAEHRLELAKKQVEEKSKIVELLKGGCSIARL